MTTLKDLILAEHSKAQAILIADIVRQKPELLDELIAYTFANKEPLSRRAGWPLRILHEQNPELFTIHIDQIIASLKIIENQSVLRNILALLAKAKIPEKDKSFLLDFTSLTLLDPKSSIAVIAHAADLFVNIADNEHFFIQELLLMLKQLEISNSGGIIAKIHQVQLIANRIGKS